MDLQARHPGTQQIARYFEYAHLPEHLQAVSRPCGELAEAMIAVLPDGPELTAGLRKLLEAKDCFVRAALPPRDVVAEAFARGDAAIGRTPEVP